MIDNEKIKILQASVADPGCFSRIPDPNSSHPGSWIPDPDPNCFHPGSRIHIKEFKYFNPKNCFLSSRKYDPGCSSRIRILIFYPTRIQGVKKAPDPGTGSATLLQAMTTLNSQAVTLARRQEKVGESTAPSMEGSISPTTSKFFMLSTLNKNAVISLFD
jgi:hypothetical protein